MVILVIVSHFTGESQVVIFFAEDSIIGRLTTLVFFYSWLIMVQRIADFKERKNVHEKNTWENYV